MLDSLLMGLDLSRAEAQLYIQLLENGSASAGQLAQLKGMARATIYDLLKRLHNKGLVKQTLRDNIKLFSAEKPEILENLFEVRRQTAEKQAAAFLKVLPQLKARNSHLYTQPTFQLFQGPEGVKHVLADILCYRHITTYSFWPIKDMIKTLSANFFEQHNAARIENKTFVKAIWPKEKIINVNKHPYLNIRLAPDNIDFSMGYWIYADKVAFLSSEKECFGFIIQSPELVQMMTVQHKLIWGLCTKFTG
jgi:sugar-specific transcriptional regulator TrmB